MYLLNPENIKIRIILSLILASNFAFSQAPVASDLFVLNGNISKDSFLIQQISLLNSFNPSGYNNQPYFLDESRVLITSQMPSDKQTEIWMLNMEDKYRINMTISPESEYSGTPVPGDGGFSCVRVETEPAGKQTIMHYFQGDPPKVQEIYNGPMQVGYYSWLDRQHIAIYAIKEKEGNELQLIDLSTNKTTLIAKNPGRCIRRSLEGAVAYVSKADSTYWFLKTFDPMTMRTEIIANCPEGSEDFEQLMDGTYIMAQNSKIFSLAPGAKTWKEIANLSALGINNIGRLAIWKKEKLILVNSH
ncbi:MAG: hypothetical protein ABIV51_13710 [Saprospiraceae bacterium]